MVLRSKQESHRTENRVIRICCDTAVSGERTCARPAMRVLTRRNCLRKTCVRNKVAAR